MLSLHTNAASLSSQTAVGRTQQALNTSLTRLGTGYRVNSSQDDAAGLQISSRLLAQTRGMAVAQKNTQNGISMLQTADGGLDELGNILLRMKDLATEAFTASTTSADKVALQSEYDALGKELSNIIKNTSFGGKQLFSDGTTTDGTNGLFSSGLTFQIGATSGETMVVNTSTNLTALATALSGVAGTYATPATPGTELVSGATNAMIDTIASTLDKVGALRAELGASANRLDHVYNNLSNMSLNTTNARGRIMDVDYAQEASNSTQQQLILQAGTSSLKQANSLSQLVLSLLQ
ncbi:flagellin [Ramlibacter sp. H39-3-26]|uniref:flagellin N-terminal helical domain-containing protein n=1 Tax=Curvibacter soli TaxID=3031331 RepID=UPI0023DBF7B1|nr:flagellin [Ramlibacter sp. H39-3-26]MDF1484230.1 flagellin [Ramlibacter sp. H39-3-26]